MIVYRGLSIDVPGLSIHLLKVKFINEIFVFKITPLVSLRFSLIHIHRHILLQSVNKISKESNFKKPPKSLLFENGIKWSITLCSSIKLTKLGWNLSGGQFERHKNGTIAKPTCHDKLLFYPRMGAMKGENLVGMKWPSDEGDIPLSFLLPLPPLYFPQPLCSYLQILWDTSCHLYIIYPIIYPVIFGLYEDPHPCTNHGNWKV